MAGYGQFCPVAKAAELLDQRWMLLVVRELVAGSHRFNDIHRGVPRMSRNLLAKRLRQLVAEGLVERHAEDGAPHYRLTAAGEELHPVIEAMGRWGTRWLDSLADEDLDPAFLMWDMRRSIDRTALPDGETVLEVLFPDLEPEVGQWWLLLTIEDVEICQENHGFDVDVVIEAQIRSFVRLWRGDVEWNDALRSGDLQVRGPTHLRRQVPDWLEFSHFSSVQRPEPVAATHGAEHPSRQTVRCPPVGGRERRAAG